MSAHPPFRSWCLFWLFALLPAMAVASETGSVNSVEIRCLEILDGITPEPPFLDFVESVDFEGVHEAYLDAGENGRVEVIWDEPGNRTHVVKTYNEAIGFENDINGFLVLNEIFRRTPSQVFGVVPVLAAFPQVFKMELDYVEGQELAHLMGDASRRLTPRQKLELEIAYWQLMDFVEVGIEALARDSWSELSIVSKEKYRYRVKYVVRFTDASGQPVAAQIFIKPDNVILQNQPRRLMIVDPQ